MRRFITRQPSIYYYTDAYSGKERFPISATEHQLVDSCNIFSIILIRVAFRHGGIVYFRSSIGNSNTLYTISIYTLSRVSEYGGKGRRFPNMPKNSRRFPNVAETAEGFRMLFGYKYRIDLDRAPFIKVLTRYFTDTTQ